MSTGAKKEKVLVSKLIEAEIRIFIGTIFLLFGAWKLSDIKGFVYNVANFYIKPFHRDPWDMWFAYLLVSLEIVVGVYLLFGKKVTGALFLSAGMLLSFSIAIVKVWFEGVNIECGCTGGKIPLGGYEVHLILLMSLLALTIYALLSKKIEFKKFY